MVAATLLLLQTAPGRSAIDPRLLGEWSYVRYPKGFGNLSLSLRPDGRFLEGVLAQTKPSPPISGRFQVHKEGRRSVLEFRNDPLRLPTHQPILRRLTYIPEIPALSEGPTGAFVPVRELNGASQRLRIYWQAQAKPRKHR